MIQNTYESSHPETKFFLEFKVFPCTSLKVEFIDHHTKVFVMKQFKEYRNQYNFSRAEQ